MFSHLKHRMRPMVRLRLSCLVLAMLATSWTAYACNIPVFRYALERWRPDTGEFIVFHREPLTAESQLQIEQLSTRLKQAGANARLTLVDLANENPADKVHHQTWSNLAEAAPPLPHLLVQLPHARGPLNVWHGPLAEGMQAALVESPVRNELTRRLLAGDSVVWLMVRSPDEARNMPVREMLQQQCRQLGSQLQLPEGIGLPGSELYSEVPLLLQFSMLEMDANDPREAFMLKVFANFQPEAYQAGEPLLVPVFGRGRALEVIPASRCDAALVRDLTAFLCGACSCQVKEQNPGFDLLISAQWDERLFGENSPLPPPPKQIGEGNAPKLLTIPPGR